jgi:hypothetical protein
MTANRGRKRPINAPGAARIRRRETDREEFPTTKFRFDVAVSFNPSPKAMQRAKS